MVQQGETGRRAAAKRDRPVMANADRGGPGTTGSRIDFDPAVDAALAIAGAAGPDSPILARIEGVSLVFGGFVTDGVPPVASRGDGTAAQILDAYLRHGARAFDALRGHFTIVVWDAGRRRLLALRDPVGMAPLFYAQTRSGLTFGSDVRALLAHPDVDASPSRTAIAESLARWPVSPEETYFDAVSRVPPGHRLRWHAGHATIEPWWEPDPEGVPDDRMRPNDLGEFDHLLMQAIGRTRSRGAAGIFLSGGLDSVSIAAASARLEQGRRSDAPHALSLAFPHPECDEVEIQRAVAEALDLDQTLLAFDEAVAPSGLIMASIDSSAGLPAPLQNPWRPAYVALAARGRDAGCRVIITGSGGDDWLTVNADYMADLLGRGRLIEAASFVRRMHASYRLPAASMARYLVWNAGLRPLLLSNARRAIGQVLPQGLEAVRLRRAIRSRPLPDWLAPDPELRRRLVERLRHRELDRIGRPEPEGRYGFYAATNVSRTFAQPLVALELEEDWAVGRRVGIDFMHPYWDPDLIRFLCRVPPRLLLSGGREKGIVRQSVARHFPELAFERRRKVSASEFFYGLLSREAPAAYARLGGLPRLAELGIVDRAAIGSAFDSHLGSSRIRLQHYAWHLIVSEAWLRQLPGAP